MDGRLSIVGVTVSLEVSSSNFGTGSKNYAAFKAEAPAEAPATLDEALMSSLDMHMAAFESVYAAAVSEGSLTTENYNKAREVFKKRRGIIKEILAKHPIEENPV